MDNMAFSLAKVAKALSPKPVYRAVVQPQRQRHGLSPFDAARGDHAAVAAVDEDVPALLRRDSGVIHGAATSLSCLFCKSVFYRRRRAVAALFAAAGQAQSKNG